MMIFSKRPTLLDNTKKLKMQETDSKSEEIAHFYYIVLYIWRTLIVILLRGNLYFFSMVQ